VHSFIRVEVLQLKCHLQSIHGVLTSSIYCTYDYGVACCFLYKPSVQESLQENGKGYSAGKHESHINYEDLIHFCFKAI